MHVNRPTDRPATECTDTKVEPIRNMHDVLSNRCRHAICYCLQGREEPTPVDTLARRLDRWHVGPAPTTDRGDATTSPARTRIYRAHLQAMADFGILGFDPVTDTTWIPDSVSISVTPPEAVQEADHDRASHVVTADGSS